MQLTGANCECNGHVWRMDVGMSGGVLNALPQVPNLRHLLDSGLLLTSCTGSYPLGIDYNTI